MTTSCSERSEGARHEHHPLQRHPLGRRPADSRARRFERFCPRTPPMGMLSASRSTCRRACTSTSTYTPMRTRSASCSPAESVSASGASRASSRPALSRCFLGAYHTSCGMPARRPLDCSISTHRLGWNSDSPRPDEARWPTGATRPVATTTAPPPWPVTMMAADQGVLGADDGIRTRDPHLGKEMETVRPLLLQSAEKALVRRLVRPVRRSRLLSGPDSSTC